MIINPQTIIDQGIIVPADGEPVMILDPDDDEYQLQQNGIDLRLASACEVTSEKGHITKFSLYKQDELRPDFQQVQPTKDGFLRFTPGNMYSLDFMEYVNPIPSEMSADIVVRSSINRFSGTVTTGWWDAGFEGRLGATYRPTMYTEIQRGVRMCQIIFYRSESARLYEGQYLKQGSHSNHGSVEAPEDKAR